MHNEPEKKETQAEAPAEQASVTDKFGKTNQKMTVLWTGLAVLAVLAIALIIYFVAKNGQGAEKPHGSGSVMGTVQIVDGQKVVVDENGDIVEVLEEDAMAIYKEVGNSSTTRVTTDTSDVVEEPAKPWTTLTDGDYDITVNTLATGYDGAFLEDGTDEEVKNVLALQFVNNSDQDIQYAEYVFGVGVTPFSFKISDLPAGQSCVVLEAMRHKYDKKEVLTLVSRVVAQVDSLPSASDQVLLVDNSDNTITIMNLTDQELPVVRVFYKYFYEDVNTFVGGITYTATAENVPASGSVTVAPSHFESGVSMLMGSGVYEAQN